MNRLYNLDYLRGIAAFGIMIHHYMSWQQHKFYESDTFIGKLGIYGVAIFYILSGLTLFYVYYDKMVFSKSDIWGFVKKRILRIYPLLWIVTLSAIAVERKMPNLIDVFLNLTGLFGFVKWHTFFSLQVWSIGNELVFYAFFPFFVFFSKSAKPLMLLLVLAIGACYLYFTFVVIDISIPLHDQWKVYTNPLNHVFLFLCGFLVGLFLHNAKISNLNSIFILSIGLIIFIFYPVQGDVVNLVTGVNRLIFSFSCLLICIGTYKIAIRPIASIHLPLALLGDISYSVYMIHPLVYLLVGIALKYLYLSDIAYIRLILAVLLTLVISYFVYKYIEKYFMKLGKNR